MKKEKRILISLLIVTIVVVTTGAILYVNQIAGKQRLTISTTTSLYDTGVLDVLKVEYEQTYPEVVLAFISAGTGIAITHAKNGDADLILVHSPDQERAFMEEGFGVNRKVFAYNYFTIVGPVDDPVNISSLSPEEALIRIYEYGQTHDTTIWISRDDNSGTNSKEKELWTLAGLDYDDLKNSNWLVSSGAGMGNTLRIADELNLYTLSDVGTFLKFQSNDLLNLAQHINSSESLINVYSAIPVNVTKVANARFNLAMDFTEWITGNIAQQLIGVFGVSEFGQPLFHPAVDIVESQIPPDIFGWIQSFAFFEFNGTLYECPPIWKLNEIAFTQSVLMSG